MKRAIALVFIISSIAHAVESTETISSNLDYCKVSYKDQNDGGQGTYRGQCKNGLPDGAGTVTFYNGDELSGSFEKGILSGDGRFKSADGSTYEGAWEDGMRHGRGTFNWARGSSYIGEWNEDERHGKGVFTWSNGNRFEGEFRNNKRYNGKYFTSTGRVYKCQYGQCK